MLCCLTREHYRIGVHGRLDRRVKRQELCTSKVRDRQEL